jgi:hypothetical protein
MPFGVSCHTEPLLRKSVFPSTDSTKRASRNLWQTERAISFAIEKVVVVVVVTILVGSFGSGIRFDCENLREPRLVRASSVVKLCSWREKRTRCELSGKLTMSVENKSLKSWRHVRCCTGNSERHVSSVWRFQSNTKAIETTEQATCLREASGRAMQAL